VEPVPGECRPEGLDVAKLAEGGDLVSPVGSFRGNGGDRGAAAEAQLTASGALGEGPAAGPVELPPVPGGVRRNQPGTDPYEWAGHPVVAEEVVSAIDMELKLWAGAGFVLRHRGQPEVAEVGDGQLGLGVPER